MNEKSLSHTNVQNQQNPSWNDEYPDFGDTFAGVANMNHERNLTDFIHKLIAYNGKYHSDHTELNLDMLSTDEQDKLVALYIESIDREIEWACYGKDESINSDFLCDMIAMLKRNTHESREKFAKTTRKNLFTYYKDALQELLVTECDIYFCNEMNDAGYYSSSDDHGDVVWGKF